MKVADVVYRKDLYPRFKEDQQTIQRYACAIDKLPPIKVNQNNILIDGYHRLQAHVLNKIGEINADVITTESEKQLKRLAYEYNSKHGMQLKTEEKSNFAKEMIDNMSAQEIASILSVTEKTVLLWTADKRKLIENQKNRDILALYLHAENTQQNIADAMDIPQQTIANKILNFTENKQMLEYGKISDPYIYNIWSLLKQTEDKDYFGAFPEKYMENLLYYHTNLFDIVYDPFAGSGTTIDTCIKMNRRYYCSDINPYITRTEEIYQHDITDGRVEKLSGVPDLVFLDPPYWKQAQNEYSNNPNDLGKLSLENFYAVFNKFLKELIAWKVKKIAIVIMPTQYNNNLVFEDHTLKFHEILFPKYEVEIRYNLPYSTQQYNAQQVEKAKENNISLSLFRDLTIWKLK